MLLGIFRAITAFLIAAIVQSLFPDMPQYLIAFLIPLIYIAFYVSDRPYR